MRPEEHNPILVIEDDPDLRVLIALLLEDRGYQVVTASNGREGLDLLERCRPDLILLDMKMPVMDGWEFAARYRAKHRRPAPIVVVTAAEDPRGRAEEVDAVRWLAKPLNLDALFAAVEEAALQHA